MKNSDSKSSAREVERQVAHCYSTWGKTYFKDYYRSASAYPPVHLDIVRNELRRHGACNVLDAGCGPASMLRVLKQLGTRRFGFDLTHGMVEEAQKVLARQGVPASHVWQGSVLQKSAYLRPGTKKTGGFEAVLCFGVLPHISEKKDGKVFSLLRTSLARGGLALVEARNELFALFTCNRYSYQFLVDRLIRVPGWKGISSKKEKYLKKCVSLLRRHFRMDLPPVRRGKAGEPGYDEVLSRTHNPLVAARQFAQAGFKDVEVLFYHYHCLPPMFERLAPAFFRRQSLQMENPREWRGHFMASAFILKGIAD
jgi:2-polyprenyl-3-methyl-5-hydroxy-6-metoxy-1,4-benzoquinol methylase